MCAQNRDYFYVSTKWFCNACCKATVKLVCCIFKLYVLVFSAGSWCCKVETFFLFLDQSDYWNISSFKILNLSEKWNLFFCEMFCNADWLQCSCHVGFLHGHGFCLWCIFTRVSHGHVKNFAVNVCIFLSVPDLTGDRDTILVPWDCIYWFLVTNNVSVKTKKTIPHLQEMCPIKGNTS